MLVEKITSRQNPLVKRFRRVRAGSERHHVFIEGVRLIEDAIRADAHFETVAFTAALEANDRGIALLDALQKVPCRGANVSKQVMEAIADTESPQGVAAIVSRPYFELKDLFARNPKLVVIADQLQDPGNLGTIIRTAEAAGADGLITTRYTVDAFNHKSLRASMGSALRLPIITDAKRADIVKHCREHKLKIVASGPEPARPQGVIEDAARSESIRQYTDADLSVPFALILGREASGVALDATATADEFLYIPMADGVESLNVSAAAAILLFEASRQQRLKGVKTEVEKVEKRKEGKEERGKRGKG
jgi:RNA methyltransferase, TrmH family